MTHRSEDSELGSSFGDPEVDELVVLGLSAHETTLQMIPSENVVSAAVRGATGSAVTDWFADIAIERTYGGAGDAGVGIDHLARRRACALFGSEHANVAPLSGSAANLAACLALMSPGDTLLGLHLDSGGHISHGTARNLSGILYRAVGYHLDPDTELVDFEALRELAHRERPAVIFCGANSYPRAIDARPFRAVCDEVGAALVFDAANVGGLIVGGAHPNPVGIADVVTLATHKTLRGPRGGALLSSAALGPQIEQAVAPGVQGTPLLHVAAAKAIAFREAAQPAFRDYIVRVVDNARTLAGHLQQAGLRLVTGGTDTHMVMIDLRSVDPQLTSSAAVALLDRAGIAANRSPVVGDPRPSGDTSGVKLGTPTVTTLGMGAPEMAVIADAVVRVLAGRDERTAEAVRRSVRTLRADFGSPPG